MADMSVTMDDIFSAFQEVLKQEVKPNTVLMDPVMYQELIVNKQSDLGEYQEFTYTIPYPLKSINITVILDDPYKKKNYAEPVGTQLEFDFGESK